MKTRCELGSWCTALFNCSLDVGRLTNSWKISEHYIFLKVIGLPENLERYRFVSLLSCTLKLITQLIKLKLENHLDSSLDTALLGFRKKSSTEEALTKLIAKIQMAFDRNKGERKLYPCICWLPEIFRLFVQKKALEQAENSFLLFWKAAGSDRKDHVDKQYCHQEGRLPFNGSSPCTYRSKKNSILRIKGRLRFLGRQAGQRCYSGQFYIQYRKLEKSS